MSVVREQDPIQSQEVGGHEVAEKLSLSSAETIFEEKFARIITAVKQTTLTSTCIHSYINMPVHLYVTC